MFRALPDILSSSCLRFNQISCVIWESLPNRVKEIKEFAVTGGIDHLKLSFVAERPPPSHKVHQELLIAAEKMEELWTLAFSV